MLQVAQSPACSEAENRFSIEPNVGGEFLAFRVGTEEYAIDILGVQEIRGYDTVTRIANAPAVIKGVVNLRGTIVPIVDLRIHFNLDRVDYNALTVVIVLNIAGMVVGVVVDGVSDVLTMGAEDIRPAPQFGNVFEHDHVIGIGTVQERMLILIEARPNEAHVAEVPATRMLWRI